MTPKSRIPAYRLLAAVVGVLLCPLVLMGQAPPRPGAGARLPAPLIPPQTPTQPQGQTPRPPTLTRQTVPPALLASPGERMYMRGLSTTGAAVAATVQGDVHVKSSEMACVNCHRRSGMGTVEGTVGVPPILGSILFQPVLKGASQLGTPQRTTGEGTRPPYTQASLLRALRDGVDPAGRTLSATMPRFSVTEADAQALMRYLQTLGADMPPGVDEAIVHVATIVTPGVTAERRASMIDVLRTFVRAKNGGSRYETRRRDNGGWDMKQQNQVYRDWVLDEWEMKGSPKEWPAQLEALYQQQPVFAIVGGIATEDWSPIDAFSARHKIPTILPQTPLPPAKLAGDGFYTMYFSQGVTLEAKAVAHHLQGASAPARVQQVSRCGTPGEAAAAALTREFKAGAILSTCVPAATTLNAAAWLKLAGTADALVLWLDAGDKAGLEALAGSSALDQVHEVYLSASLLGDEATRMPGALAAKGLLVDPFVPPDEFEKQATRSLVWMKANGINPADRRVAVNAFFAIVIAADALNLPRTLDSREYFVERIEHMTGQSLNPTAYPSVSFDAKRRFGSAGSYLLKLPSAPGEPFRKVEEWYVPKS